MSIAARDLAPEPGMPRCLSCSSPLTHTFVDLGLQPLANSYVPPERAHEPEPRFPLHARVCDNCLLVQVDAVQAPENIFVDYAYFSSYSESWLKHCSDYADAMTDRFRLGTHSRVVEIGSNDGYLLQYFVAKGMRVLGIEPAANVAQAAIERGVPTDIAFFGVDTARRLAESGWSADLLAAKNVLAHVPDINDFVAGIRLILKPDGVFTVEFPHLLNLIREVQFDTIYHEHFTYLSVIALKPIFERHGLTIFDVEKQDTHGGSLRLFVVRTESDRQVSDRVREIPAEERAAQLDRPAGYDGFEPKVQAIRSDVRAFLATAKAEGKKVIAYGAAAKGNTLLNYCGASADDIEFVVDRNPEKQGRLLPGSHIPVRSVEALVEARPDYVFILPWNLRDEIMSQLPEVAAWGGQFVTAIPQVQIHSGAH